MSDTDMQHAPLPSDDELMRRLSRFVQFPAPPISSEPVELHLTVYQERVLKRVFTLRDEPNWLQSLHTRTERDGSKIFTLESKRAHAVAFAIKLALDELVQIKDEKKGFWDIGKIFRNV